MPLLARAAAAPTAPGRRWATAPLCWPSPATSPLPPPGGSAVPGLRAIKLCLTFRAEAQPADARVPLPSPGSALSCKLLGPLPSAAPVAGRTRSARSRAMPRPACTRAPGCPPALLPRQVLAAAAAVAQRLPLAGASSPVAGACGHEPHPPVAIRIGRWSCPPHLPSCKGQQSRCATAL